MKPIAGLLKAAVVHKATDLYLRADRVPALRLGARLHFLDEPPTPAEVLLEMARGVGLDPPARLEAVHEVAGLGRFRVLGVCDAWGRLDLSIRVHPAWGEGSGPTWLGLADDAPSETGPGAWTVIAGPSGSGRTSLMHELAARVLRSRRIRMLYISPWPELELRDQKGVVTAWAGGRDLVAPVQTAVASGVDLVCLDLPGLGASQLAALQSHLAAGPAVWTALTAACGAEVWRVLADAGLSAGPIYQLFRLRMGPFAHAKGRESAEAFGLVRHAPGRSPGVARAQVEDDLDAAEAAALATWVREGRISAESAATALGRGGGLELALCSP